MYKVKSDLLSPLSA